MSMPVELALRQELAATFAAELVGRIYGLVSPPDALLPLVTYRRLGSGPNNGPRRVAQMQVTIRDREYTDLKRLQHRIETHLTGLARTWMGDPPNDECAVWVHSISARTLADGFQPSTRLLQATSDIEIVYSDVSPQP